MKKYAIIILISLFGVLASKTIYVKPDGSNSNGGTSWDDAYQWISFAIENAEDYDTIMLRGTFTLTDADGKLIDLGVIPSGINSGLNIIKKSLTFRGEDRNTTIVQSYETLPYNDDSYDGSTPYHRVFYIYGGETNPITVNFENLTIQNGCGDPGGGIYTHIYRDLDIPSTVSVSNCNIVGNIRYHDPTTNNSESGGGGISITGAQLLIDNSVISNNINFKHSGGGIFYCPTNTKSAKCIISNSVILQNSTKNIDWTSGYALSSGGGLFIANNFSRYPEVAILNTTFTGNVSALRYGHAIGAGIYSNLDLTINSCTIVDNYHPTNLQTGCAIFLFDANEEGALNISNSIISNTHPVAEVINENLNSNSSVVQPGFDYVRSYTISSDEYVPNPFGSTGNLDNIPKETIITGIRNEEGTHFYKIIAGSPAKDAIPFDEDDEGNPFNGAGNYIVDDEGNPILDEYGNIQVLDQRGFNVWNQKKDIGAYESPYYWVDVDADDNDYTTIDYMETKLMVADPVEHESAEDEDKWKWTDYMRAQSGGRIILSDNSEIIKYDDGSELNWYDGSYMDVAGSSRITNGADFIAGANADIFDGAQLSLLNSSTTIPASASFNIGNDSKFVLEGESAVTFANGLNIESNENAEISLYGPSCLNAEGATFSYTGTEGDSWLGINGQTGSSIDINNVSITGAVKGVSADTPAIFKVTNSTFEGCINGIDLTGIKGLDYTITDNTLTGIEDGRGITITSVDGVFSRNKISRFNVGASFIMSSPVVSKCEFTYNKYHGILVSGNDALPQLINTGHTHAVNEHNCLIEKNAYVSGTSIFPSSQIGIIPVGNIYMRDNDIISSINYPGISIAQAAVMNQHIIVDAQYNYWGAEQITDDYFFGHTDYTIDYQPYYSYPSGTMTTDPEIMQSISTESRLLSNALNLEFKDKLTPAINLYEQIIKKYVDTPEYYVAMARLPYLYDKAGLDNNELIALFDEALESDKISHKKFFKGKKVATHIKGKRYDEAIAVAEEMKTEADFEEEIILADINIAIANMLKDSDGKGKSGKQPNVKELISELFDYEDKAEPSDITETQLPSQHELYQNYPNPFNPVTSIKFALANTANVKLNVYNISGQLVSQLANGTMNAGIHAVDFDGSKLNSGVYYYTLEVDGKNMTKKMVLTK